MIVSVKMKSQGVKIEYVGGNTAILIWVGCTEKGSFEQRPEGQ